MSNFFRELIWEISDIAGFNIYANNIGATIDDIMHEEKNCYRGNLFQANDFDVFHLNMRDLLI